MKNHYKKFESVKLDVKSYANISARVENPILTYFSTFYNEIDSQLQKHAETKIHAILKFDFGLFKGYEGHTKAHLN